MLKEHGITRLYSYRYNTLFMQQKSDVLIVFKLVLLEQGPRNCEINDNGHSNFFLNQTKSKSSSCLKHFWTHVVILTFKYSHLKSLGPKNLTRSFTQINNQCQNNRLLYKTLDDIMSIFIAINDIFISILIALLCIMVLCSFQHILGHILL